MCCLPLLPRALLLNVIAVLSLQPRTVFGGKGDLAEVHGSADADGTGYPHNAWYSTAVGFQTALDDAVTQNANSAKLCSRAKQAQENHDHSQLSWRRQRILQDTSVAAATSVRSPSDLFKQQALGVSCSAESTRKQTCIFNNVCLIPTANTNSSMPPYLTVLLPLPASDSSSSSSNRRAGNGAANLLQRHLGTILAGQSQYQGIVYVAKPDDIPFSIDLTRSSHSSSNSMSSSSGSSNNATLKLQAVGTPATGTDLSAIGSGDLHIEQGVSVLWRVERWHQESFGHALLNEAFPIFMVLSNMFGAAPQDVPRRLQLLVAADGWTAHALPHVLKELITHNTQLLHEKLQGLQQQGKAGICFRHLIVGDGGYPQASRSSLANSGQPEAQAYSVGPSFFSSRNWMAFREYSLQVAGVITQDRSAAGKPLILLNDKRYHSGSSSSSKLRSDRRMIIDVDQLASDLRTAYPSADVVAVRFRDLSWPDQLRIMSQAAVFITTQGSSAFRWLWLPHGSTCIVVGAPEGPQHTEWKSFHELDRWFPLSYVTFQRYKIDVKNTEDYSVSVVPGHWQPKDLEAAKRWWLYNADVRVRVERLRPMINQALGL